MIEGGISKANSNYNSSLIIISFKCSININHILRFLDFFMFIKCGHLFVNISNGNEVSGMSCSGGTFMQIKIFSFKDKGSMDS
jgi:hypothetical protein